MSAARPRQASLQVRVKPRASRSGLLGRHGKGVKIAVRAAPERGHANEELLQVVATALGVPAGSVSLVAGAASQDKHLRVEGLDQKELERRLTKTLGANKER